MDLGIVTSGAISGSVGDTFAVALPKNQNGVEVSWSILYAGDPILEMDPLEEIAPNSTSIYIGFEIMKAGHGLIQFDPLFFPSNKPTGGLNILVSVIGVSNTTTTQSGGAVLAPGGGFNTTTPRGPLGPQHTE